MDNESIRYLLDIEGQKEFFTGDRRFFIKIVSFNKTHIAAKTFEKINNEYQEKRAFITTPEELTEGFDQYNEELDIWEDEFYEED